MQKSSPNGKRTYITKEDGEFLIKATYRAHLQLRNLVLGAEVSSELYIATQPYLKDLKQAQEMLEAMHNYSGHDEVKM